MPVSADLRSSPDALDSQTEQGRSPALFGAMVVVASLIHGGVLLIPLPSPPPPEPELDQVENVPITRLPTPTPIPPAKSQRPESQTPPPNPQPPKPQPNPQPPRISAPPPNPQPSQTQPNNPQPSPAPTPSPHPQPESEPKPEPTPIPSPEPEPDPPDLIPDFPHVSGAVAGCQGREDCYAVPGGTLWGVRRNLRASLEAQGYQLRERADLGDDQGMRIDEVTHPDRPEPLFLTVFSFYSPETGDMARYILAEEPVEDLADL